MVPFLTFSWYPGMLTVVHPSSSRVQLLLIVVPIAHIPRPGPTFLSFCTLLINLLNDAQSVAHHPAGDPSRMPRCLFPIPKSNTGGER